MQKRQRRKYKSAESRQRKRMPPGIWRRMARAAPVWIFATLLTVALTRWSAFGEVEPVIQDALMRLDGGNEESRVAVVLIDDKSYDDVFDATSPLSPDRLRQLIAATAKARPLAIGVDIKTSDQQYQSFQLTDWGVPVVWLRETRLVNEHREYGFTDRLLGRHLAPPKLQPLQVLGRTDPFLFENSGVERFISDGGGARFYRRAWESSTPGELLPSFTWVIMKRLPAGLSAGLEASTDPLLIRYEGDQHSPRRWQLTAAQVLEYAKQARWSENSPLLNKIILIGGSYRDSDLGNTPLGEMPGVFVHANIMETELRREDNRPLAGWVLILLQFVEGIGLVLLFHVFSFRKALIIALLLTPVVAVVLSLLTSLSFARWSYFAPVFLGILLYQCFEHFKDYRKELVKEIYKDGGGVPRTGGR